MVLPLTVLSLGGIEPLKPLSVPLISFARSVIAERTGEHAYDEHGNYIGPDPVEGAAAAEAPPVDATAPEAVAPEAPAVEATHAAATEAPPVEASEPEPTTE